MRRNAPRGDGSGLSACRNLLSRPGPELTAGLEQVLAAVAQAFPIPASHRKDLPYAVRDLSRILTSERGALARPYWAAPRYLAAYLRYFLPWNLLRLAWLAPDLDLGLRPGARILDLGSGPLTLPLALWLARPDMRTMPLEFVCADVAVKPMECGRAVFKALAGPDAPWTIRLVRASAERALRVPRGGEYDCIMAANLLNELCEQGGGPPLSRRLEDLTARASAALRPKGRLLLVEPGTRLGGKLIALSRQGALQQGFFPLAPCTHDGPCPMSGSMAGEDELPPAKGGAPQGRRRTAFSGWCHFVLPARGAPTALDELCRRAGLEKERLSLSCLLLEAGLREQTGEATGRESAALLEGDLDELESLYNEIMAGDEQTDRPLLAEPAGGAVRRGPGGKAGSGSKGFVRVISDPISLPGHSEPGRYSCCEKGLALLLDAFRTPSGASVLVAWPEREERDAKTGALLLRREGERRKERAAQTKPRETPGRAAGGKAGTSGAAAKPGGARRAVKGERTS